MIFRYFERFDFLLEFGGITTLVEVSIQILTQLVLQPTFNEWRHYLYGKTQMKCSLS